MDATAIQLPETTQESLTSLLETARKTAVERGWPVLASLTLELPSAPVRSLPSMDDCWVWEQPSRGIRLAAAGAAVELQGEGEARYDTLRDSVEALFATAVLEPTAATPLALTGFCFDAEAWRDGTWEGFPDALAFVPRLLATTRDGHTTMTLSHLVAADADVEASAATLVADAERWINAGASGDEATSSNDQRNAGEVHEEWDDDVRDLVERIGRGEAEKVVLARRVTLKLERGFDAEAVLQRLRARYPDCTLFVVRRGDATFVGATPELLVSLSGREVRADCLAGTARRGTDEAADRTLAEALLADDKERREHALVVRGLTDSLAPVCSAIDVPSEPGLRRTATVQHLHSPVRAETDRRRHVLELVQRLHPTPATAGLPRETSMCLIRQHEKFDRGWYAGPVGWLDANGDGEFAVALRSALVRRTPRSTRNTLHAPREASGSGAAPQDDVALLYAGCGIVAGSDPEREYVEAGAKLEAMRWALTA